MYLCVCCLFLCILRVFVLCVCGSSVVFLRVHFVRVECVCFRLQLVCMSV